MAPMTRDDAIWDQLASLTTESDSAGPGVDLPPIPEGGTPRAPLRVILRRYLDAPETERDKMTLRLANGESFNAPDIAELLMRDDCPVK
jgi:hypothetical protein